MNLKKSMKNPNAKRMGKGAGHPFGNPNAGKKPDTFTNPNVVKSAPYMGGKC